MDKAEERENLKICPWKLPQLKCKKKKEREQNIREMCNNKKVIHMHDRNREEERR